MQKPKYPNIEAERARRGMSVAELMQKIGVKSRKTYVNWCNNGRIPQKRVEKMADVFGCSVDYLLGNTPNIKH